MAPPIKKVDIKQIKTLAMINCSYAEIAAVVGVNESPLTRRYAQVIKEGREQGKSSLKREMWRAAIDKGNITMMIFLSKNMLGYSDKVETKTDGSNHKTITLQYTLPNKKSEVRNDEKENE
jgi:hypothetical protein